MTCNCRASALRIFVQSLTRVPISGATPRQAHLLDPKAFGAYASSGSIRRFTAASASCYPRQPQRTPTQRKADLYGQVEQSHDTSDPIQTTSFHPPATEASANEIDQAKSSNAIFDLSPEAIDALAAGLRRTPIEQDPSDTSNAGQQDEADAPVRQKAEFSGPSRLKRSKILPADDTAWEHADPPARKRENWQIQKEALKEKFPEGWNPRKKLSPDALDGIRALHTQYPQIYTTQVLANQFQVSAEAIRRILKSKWKPTTEEDEDRQQRWFNRGKNIWSQMAELGTKPPKKWRQAGVMRDAKFNTRKSPKTEYPHVPKWKEKQSAQRKLGDNIL